MSIHIVHEYPAPSRPRRLARALLSLLGVLLVAGGPILSPASIVHVFAFIEAPNLHSAIVIPLPVACLLLGLRLIRGKRRLVLFLRRFGFAGATQAENLLWEIQTLRSEMAARWILVA